MPNSIEALHDVCGKWKRIWTELTIVGILHIQQNHENILCYLVHFTFLP